jgi:hypothetical protein
MEKFPGQEMPGHRNAPLPQEWLDWRKGSNHPLKRRFLAKRAFSFPVLQTNNW